VVSKKRYLIGETWALNDQVHAWLHPGTAGISDDMKFLVTTRVNRFHFVGGRRFIHGGAWLQESGCARLKVHRWRGRRPKTRQWRNRHRSLVW